MSNQITELKPLGDRVEMLVPVQREWYGWRLGQARLCDLEDVHWFQPAGAPRSLLHAYVSSSKIVSGDLVDPADGGALPPRLLVCVLKSHAAPATYGALATRATDKQPSAPNHPAPDTSR